MHEVGGQKTKTKQKKDGEDWRGSSLPLQGLVFALVFAFDLAFDFAFDFAFRALFHQADPAFFAGSAPARASALTLPDPAVSDPGE
ncbi:MAG: hypothetical protein HQL57_04115 [Magnetococcales bacterium]|nr:hypothetical protein [Magnetococcales bacterium]MBF0156348.1 hypothetical protein [Magnetococcales bacterium]